MLDGIVNSALDSVWQDLRVGHPLFVSLAGSRLSLRCGQPGQQQGLRFPSLRLEQPYAMRRVLVSTVFADWIQQIHSLRARGVMSSHVSNAFASEVSALLRSAGRSWTTPPEISFSLRAWLMSLSPECEVRRGRDSKPSPAHTKSASWLKAAAMERGAENSWNAAAIWRSQPADR